METGSPIEVKLHSIQYAARDTHLYELLRTDGGRLPAATAGAHIDLHLPNGLVRQYSVTVPDEAPRSYIVGIKRDPQSSGGSKYIFDELRVGHLLNISAPRNNVRLDESAAHTILFAGGIGITPIWAMVQRLVALRRPWELYYSCRARADAAFYDLLAGRPEVHFHFDDEHAGRYLELASIINASPTDAHLYCCGPTPMLQIFEQAVVQIPPDRVHVEYFTSKDVPSLEGGFIVHLARSGQEFVIPAGKSILSVLRDAGVSVAYSCEEGVCGTCETAVISGIPDHRDSVLSEAERASNKSMMICSSGAKSKRLVLDL